MTGPAEGSEVRGPMMIAATTILRPPPARIGKIGNNITLPRTIPVVNAVAGAVGALVCIPIMIIVFPPLTAVIFGIVFGAFGGVAFVTYSPLKGESMLRWMGLSLLNARRRRVVYEGEEVRLAIGVARISRGPLGRVRIVGGAVNVNPDQFDERGVLRVARNRNLSPTSGVARFPAGDQPGAAPPGPVGAPMPAPPGPVAPSAPAAPPAPVAPSWAGPPGAGRGPVPGRPEPARPGPPRAMPGRPTAPRGAGGDGEGATRLPPPRPQPRARGPHAD